MAQRGRIFIVEVNTTGTTWVPVGGLRSKSLTQNRETIDVTNSDHTDLQRRLLDGGGVGMMSFSGSGLFEDNAGDTEINSLVASGQTKPWRITCPNFGVWQGAFQVTQYEHSGEHNGAQQFTLTLESAGSWTFTTA